MEAVVLQNNGDCHNYFSCRFSLNQRAIVVSATHGQHCKNGAFWMTHSGLSHQLF